MTNDATTNDATTNDADASTDTGGIMRMFTRRTFGLTAMALGGAAALATSGIAGAHAEGAGTPAGSSRTFGGTRQPPGLSAVGEIALLPLDDRPYTWYGPAKLGAGAGYRITTPTQQVLGRHFSPGDGAAAAAWLVAAARAADDAVVALPMLAYGGLLNSRNSSVPQATALQQLAAVRTVRQQNPRGRLYAFDTIMRLTPEGPWRTQLRIWATLVDEVDNLGQEAKRAELERVAAEIPQEVRDDYLATRQRNHEINQEMIRWAADGVFDFLVVGQDDATGTGLHRPEALALHQLIDELGVADRVVLYPGADVVASLLLAKIAVADAGVRPAVYVEYSRLHGSQWTAPFQNITHEALVHGYVGTIGGRITTDIDDADIVLMSNTGGSTASVAPFVDRVVRHLDEGRVVALGDDAIAGVTDRRMTDLLDAKVQRGRLDSYSGWNIGVPIAQSMSRQAVLARAAQGRLFRARVSPPTGRIALAHRDLLLAAAQHSLELVLSEWVQTNAYRSFVRNDTTAHASALGEPDPQNIRTHFDAIQEFARSRTEPIAQQMFDDHFAAVPRPVGAIDGSVATVAADEVVQWQIFLPWLRTGEIAAEPEVHLVPTV